MVVAVGLLRGNGRVSAIFMRRVCVVGHLYYLIQQLIQHRRAIFRRVPPPNGLCQRQGNHQFCPCTGRRLDLQPRSNRLGPFLNAQQTKMTGGSHFRRAVRHGKPFCALNGGVFCKRFSFKITGTLRRRIRSHKRRKTCEKNGCFYSCGRLIGGLQFG